MFQGLRHSQRTCGWMIMVVLQHSFLQYYYKTIQYYKTYNFNCFRGWIPHAGVGSLKYNRPSWIENLEHSFAFLFDRGAVFIICRRPPVIGSSSCSSFTWDQSEKGKVIGERSSSLPIIAYSGSMSISNSSLCRGLLDSASCTLLRVPGLWTMSKSKSLKQSNRQVSQVQDLGRDISHFNPLWSVKNVTCRPCGRRCSSAQMKARHYFSTVDYSFWFMQGSTCKCHRNFSALHIFLQQCSPKTIVTCAGMKKER